MDTAAAASNPANQILLEIQLQLNQLQQQVQQGFAEVAAEQRRAALEGIRHHNCGAQRYGEARIRYPPGTDHAALEILARTVSEAISISDENAGEALVLLGVDDPGNIEHRLRFWQHIGIAPSF